MKKRIVFLLLVLALLIPVAVASAAYYHVNTSWLKLRTEPSTSATVMDSYRRDFAMTIERKYDDGWAFVKITNGKKGYVQTQYLKSSKSYSAWVTTDNTALRKGPDYSFGNVGKLAKGVKVTVLSHGSKYDYVSSSVGRGYVRNSLLSKKKVTRSKSSSVNLDGSIADSNGQTGPTDPFTAYVNNPNDRTVNLRRGAGKSYSVITSYRPGTQLTVLEIGPEWCKVRVSVDGKVGYMMSQYISTTRPASPSSPIDPNTGEPAEPGSDGPSVTDNPMPAGIPYSATVTSPDGKPVNVRKGPGLGYSDVTRLSVGTVVTVIEWTSTHWCKIQMDDGRTGYIRTEYLSTNR